VRICGSTAGGLGALRVMHIERHAIAAVRGRQKDRVHRLARRSHRCARGKLIRHQLINLAL
jgi:hypothetical protein